MSRIKDMLENEIPITNSNLKKCPFCGSLPIMGGFMLDRKQKEKVRFVSHPETGKCPLDILIFRENEWSKRV